MKYFLNYNLVIGRELSFWWYLRKAQTVGIDFTRCNIDNMQIVKNQANANKMGFF